MGKNNENLRKNGKIYEKRYLAKPISSFLVTQKEIIAKTWNFIEYK